MKVWPSIWFAGALICAGLLAPAVVESKTRALIATGLGGEERYENQFQRHASTVAGHMEEITDDVTLLTGDDVRKENFLSALTDIGARTGEGDALVVILIGHGSYDGERFKFNIPGPDFTGEELAGWLDPLAALHQLVVVTGSASGAALADLTREGRTVITATRSGEQRNATVFSNYFTSALSEDAADTDKDQAISAAEAFAYAQTGVGEYYESRNTMATEHPQSVGGESAVVLARLAGMPEIDPAYAGLYEQRDALTLAIASLRADKENYTLDDYFAELQRLLLELAVVESSIDSSGDQP